MAKFRGNIGCVKTEETSPGVWTDVTSTRLYSGDVIRNTRRWQQGDKINEDLTISNQISIVSDQFILDNLAFIKFVEFMGIQWKITDVSVEYPRLILTLGGIYNGNET